MVVILLITTVLLVSLLGLLRNGGAGSPIWARRRAYLRDHEAFVRQLDTWDLHQMPRPPLALALAPPDGSHPKRTLVVYAFAQAEWRLENLRFFLRHGLVARTLDGSEVDYTFVFNGFVAPIEEFTRHNITYTLTYIKQGTNLTDVRLGAGRGAAPPQPSWAQPHARGQVHVVVRENAGFDMCASKIVLERGLALRAGTYTHVVLMNGSVRGPFLPSYMGAATWVDVFQQFLRGNVRMVGTTVNCLSSLYQRPKGFASLHLQSMVLALDAEGVRALQPMLQCYANMSEAISHGEVGSTQAVLRAGYGVAALQGSWQGFPIFERDLATVGLARRCAAVAEETGGDPTLPGAYLDGEPQPRELVFIKTNRNLDLRLLRHETLLRDMFEGAFAEPPSLSLSGAEAARNVNADHAAVLSHIHAWDALPEWPLLPELVLAPAGVELPKRTLVIFSGARAGTENLRFFIRHGLVPRTLDGGEVDYTFMLNGHDSPFEEFTHHNVRHTLDILLDDASQPNDILLDDASQPNGAFRGATGDGPRVHVVVRQSGGSDFCAFNMVLEHGLAARAGTYTHVVLMNSGVRGPFLPSYVGAASWVDIFQQYLRENVRMVGTTVNCLSSLRHRRAGFTSLHLQSSVFALDAEGMRALRPMLRCYANMSEAISHGEVGATQAVLRAGYGVAALQGSWQGFPVFERDLTSMGLAQRCAAVAEETGGDPMMPGAYLGAEPQPLEVVFFNTLSNAAGRLQHETKLRDMYE